MTIQDLSETSPDEPLDCELCVIGSGPAGLCLARAAIERGLRVVLLEGGPRRGQSCANAAVHFVRRAYAGATVGRATGLGGTSALWGGQLLPMRGDELAGNRFDASRPWPLRMSDLEPHYATLCQWFGVDQSPFEEIAPAMGESASGAQASTIQLRWSKWIPLSRRNLARAWRVMLDQSKLLHCWVNAPVEQFESEEDKGTLVVRRVLCRSAAGAQLRVNCRQVAICAGAVDTPRLVAMLLARSPAPEASQASVHNGRWLHDHLSLRVARIKVLNRRQFAARLAPRFRGQTMQSARLDLTADCAGKLQLPAAYGHVSVEAPADSAFAALRDALRALQAGQASKAAKCALRLVGSLPELVELLWWRFVRRRLIFSRRADLYLQVDFAMQRELSAWWERRGLTSTALLQCLDIDAIVGRWPENMYDIYHPAGTTRMATSAREGVVDPRLQVFGTANCSVVSSSVFPSLGAANPTFTIMALALRLAERLAHDRAPQPA
jgi:hypothetical protein